MLGLGHISFNHTHTGGQEIERTQEGTEKDRKREGRYLFDIFSFCNNAAFRGRKEGTGKEEDIYRSTSCERGGRKEKRKEVQMVQLSGSRCRIRSVWKSVRGKGGERKKEFAGV